MAEAGLVFFRRTLAEEGREDTNCWRPRVLVALRLLEREISLLSRPWEVLGLAVLGLFGDADLLLDLLRRTRAE